jgi:hypothetical protein
MLDLRLRVHAAAIGAEEVLAESGRNVLRVDAAKALAAMAVTLALVILIVGLLAVRNARCDSDVHDGRRDARRDGFNGVIERNQRRDAVVIERAGCSGGVRAVVIDDEREHEEKRGSKAGGNRELPDLCY